MKRTAQAASSIRGILRRSYTAVICSLTIPLVITLLLLVVIVNTYNGAVDRIDCAAQAQNVLEQELPSEIWNIISGRKTFEQGEQYAMLDQLYGLMDDLTKTASDGQQKYLNAAVRALDTLEGYIKALGVQTAQGAAVSWNESLYQEITSVTLLAADMLDQYSAGEIELLSVLNRRINLLVMLLAAAAVLTVCGVVYASVRTYRRVENAIRKPILRMERMAARIAKGDMEVRLQAPTIAELYPLANDLNRMAEQLDRLIAEQIEQEKTLKKAELRALQAQIAPHFVYNTLETIVWLAEEGKCTATANKLTCSNIGLVDGKEELVESVTVTNGEPSLKYENISITPDSILSSGTVTVSAKVTNTGEGLAAAVFQINDNGTDRYIYQFGDPATSRVIGLNPGESRELSGTLELTELGRHTLQMAGYTKNVEVGFREATYAYSNLRVKLGDGEISDLTSDRLHVKADVKNIGNEAGTAEVPLIINGKTLGTQQIALDAGETKTVEFTYTFPSGGEYQVTIGDAAAQTVSILGEIQGVPIVKDQSGMGNDGLIRGNPTLVQYDGGYGLSLDGVDDYVEIPDRQNYTVDDGVTGMVWANIDRLAQEGEWDHNPLLVKGASISYGTNYLYRMAVRQTGMVTYGIGFNNDNGEYFWNDDDSIEGAGVQLGEWVQYTGGFDRATGGTSWENTKQSGEIDPPDFDSEIKNWPGSSMYAGFSFHRHLLTDRNRGKTHTMLTGDIGQIRFYTAKLTEDENAAIYAAPSEKGPKADDLVVWLDFTPEHIVTDGRHTTEWRASDGAIKSMDYDVELNGAASAKVTVETSDDGKTVKSSQQAELKNGKGTIDLGGLGEANYVRIVTDLHSSVTEQATDMPVIRSYTVNADSKNTWATLAAWNEGTFEGAAGYEPTDFLKDYAADFDDYSGTADATAEASGEAGSLIGADVPQSHWAYETIRTMIDKGIISGDAETGNIRPEDTITREEVAKTLLSTLQIPVTETGTIAQGDRSSEWAKDILATARAQGIMQGDERGYMNGQDNASRAEVVTMVARAAEIASDDLSVLDRFADGAAVPEYAKQAAAGMIEQGMLNGYEDNMLHLERPILRAETFTLLEKLIA